MLKDIQKMRNSATNRNQYGNETRKEVFFWKILTVLSLKKKFEKLRKNFSKIIFRRLKTFFVETTFLNELTLKCLQKSMLASIQICFRTYSNFIRLKYINFINKATPLSKIKKTFSTADKVVVVVESLRRAA